MAARSRDRVTIDLCGIGAAARAAARARGATLAVFARQSLIAALPGDAAAMLPRAESNAGLTATIKLSVRLSAADSPPWPPKPSHSGYRKPASSRC
jgi:hypothetical protein